MKKQIKIILMVACLSLLLSCTTNGTFVVENDDSGAFFLDSIMTENLYKTMTVFGEVDESENLFSSDLVKSFFSQAGLTLSSVVMENPREIAFIGNSPDIKAIRGTGAQPVSLVDNGTSKIFTLLLTEETMETFVSSLSEESLTYIDLLQAPLFTREEMSAKEYEEFIAALYGQTLSDDLQDSFVALEFNIPKVSKEVSVYPKNLATIKKEDKKIVFNIKLSELLANSSEARFEIIWE